MNSEYTHTGVFCMAVVGAASALIVDVLLGYPLLLRWLANLHNNPVCKDAQLRLVSVVLPVHNGERFLQRKLKSLLSLNYPRELMEIMVLSDGSEDHTYEIARSFASEGVRFMRIARSGKAAAINAAVPEVGGEILVLTDVRQSLEPDCLRNAIGCFGDPKVGAVSANVFVSCGESRAEYDNGMYYRYELWMRKQMARIDSSFGCTGSFYALRRFLWTAIPANILLDDVYRPLTAFFKGYRLVLEPTAIVHDFSTTLDSEFGRKLRTQAGLYQLLQVMPELFSSGNRMRLHFLSAKYGRTIIPYCLILIAMATLGLPAPSRTVVAAGQASFYALAALDILLPSHFPLRRLTSPLRTFVVLMTASLLGAKVFFTPPRSLCKETKVCDRVGEVREGASDIGLAQSSIANSQGDRP
jgi:biofilm PGA synthesis N-glycosyltransferase PgaC